MHLLPDLKVHQNKHQLFLDSLRVRGSIFAILLLELYKPTSLNVADCYLQVLHVLKGQRVPWQTCSCSPKGAEVWTHTDIRAPILMLHNTQCGNILLNHTQWTTLHVTNGTPNKDWTAHSQSYTMGCTTSYGHIPRPVGQACCLIPRLDL